MPPRAVAALAALLALAPVALAPAARADPMRVLESRPIAQSTMTGPREEFFVRFDTPVDHHASRLIILRRGETANEVVRELRPRLNASPETLYAVAGGLPPGPYALRWVAKSQRDGNVTEGLIDFTIR